MGEGSEQEQWDHWPRGYWKVLKEGPPPSFLFSLLSPSLAWTQGKDFRRIPHQDWRHLRKGGLRPPSALGPLFGQHTVCMTKEKGKDSRAERGRRRTYSPSTKEGEDVWVSQESAGTMGRIYVWDFSSVPWLLPGWHLTPGSVIREAVMIKQRLTTEV